MHWGKYAYLNVNPKLTCCWHCAAQGNDITDANGNVVTLTRNPNNAVQITEIIDPVGRKLRLSYDGTDRITLVTDPIGRRVEYTYNAFGTLETVTDPIGGVTRYDYSAANRLTQVTDARGVVVIKTVLAAPTAGFANVYSIFSTPLSA